MSGDKKVDWVGTICRGVGVETLVGKEGHLRTLLFPIERVEGCPREHTDLVSEEVRRVSFLRNTSTQKVTGQTDTSGPTDTDPCYSPSRVLFVLFGSKRNQSSLPIPCHLYSQKLFHSSVVGPSSSWGPTSGLGDSVVDRDMVSATTYSQEGVGFTPTPSMKRRNTKTKNTVLCHAHWEKSSTEGIGLIGFPRRLL